MWFYLSLGSAMALAVGCFLLEKGKLDGISNDKLLFGFYLSSTIGFMSVLVSQNYFSLSLTEVLIGVIIGVIIGITSLIMNILFVNSFKYGPLFLASKKYTKRQPKYT